MALRALLEPHAGALVDMVVKKALKGDMTAARICIDRLIPPVKARNDVVKLPGMGGSLVDQGKAVLEAAGRGELSPDEVSMLMQALAAQASITKVDDLVQRVAALEKERRNAQS